MQGLLHFTPLVIHEPSFYQLLFLHFLVTAACFFLFRSKYFAARTLFPCVGAALYSSFCELPSANAIAFRDALHHACFVVVRLFICLVAAILARTTSGWILICPSLAILRPHYRHIFFSQHCKFQIVSLLICNSIFHKSLLRDR